MNIKNILDELDEIVNKLKLKIMFLQTENKDLKKRIIELKKYIENV